MKKFLKKLKYIIKYAAALALVCAILAGGCYGAAAIGDNRYRIHFYHVVSPKVGENTRVVFVSDLHLKEYGAENSSLLKNIEELKPDMIILGGDLVTRDEADYGNMLEFCSRLKEIAPTYGVPGNHEDEKRYLDADKKIFSEFKDTGIHYLVNEKEEINIKGVTFEICGVRGTVASYEKYGGKELMDSLGDTDNFRISVAHIPYLYKKGLENYDYDLALAGHVHGGLIRIPGIGGLYSAEEGLFPDFAEGQQKLPNGANLIISRGMGDSSKLVPRINNSHELCVIDINWY